MSSEPEPTTTPSETQAPLPGGISCDIARTRLAHYRDGELDEHPFAQVRAHLFGCAECRAELLAHERLSEMARGWNVRTPDLWERIAGRLDTYPPRDAASILAERQLITPEQVRLAREVQRHEGGSITRILRRFGFASERDVEEARAAAERVPFIDLRKHTPEPSAVAMLPAQVAKKHRALPVKKDGRRLWVAMADPRDVAAADEVRIASGCLVVPMHAVPEDLDAALTEAYAAVPPADPPRPPTAVGAPAPPPDEDALPPRSSFWSRFGQRVADAFSTGGNPTPQQMMEARDLLRHAADEIDAMLASVGFAQKPPLPNNELAEIRREIAGLREEVAALRRPEARPTMATTATVSRYVEAPPDLMPYAPPGEAPTPLT